MSFCMHFSCTEELKGTLETIFVSVEDYIGNMFGDVLNTSDDLFDW